MNRALPLAVLLALSACAGAQLEKQKKENADLREQAGGLATRLKEKADEVEALKGAKSDLESRIKELEGRLEAAEARIASLSASNKDLASSVAAKQGELGERISAVMAEKDEIARKLSEEVKEKLALDRLKGIYRSARDKAAADLARLKSDRDALLAQLESRMSLAKAADAAAKQAEQARTAALAATREEMGSVADAALKEIQSGKASIEQKGESFELTLGEPLLFEPGSAKLKDSGAALLERVGAALRALTGRAVRVEGHMDNAEAKKGLFGSIGPWELSSERATAVARWLHEHGGVDPARLSAVGRGEFSPLKPNDTPEHRAANRRVTIISAPTP